MRSGLVPSRKNIKKFFNQYQAYVDDRTSIGSMYEFDSNMVALDTFKIPSAVIELKNASHLISNQRLVKSDDDKLQWIADIEILDTPNGKVLQQDIRNMFSISSVGTTNKKGNYGDDAVIVELSYFRIPPLQNPSVKFTGFIRETPERKFYKLIESNDSEGETWNFYFPVEGNENVPDRLNKMFEENEDIFEFEFESIAKDVIISESEVDVLIKHDTRLGYMSEHNKLDGIIDIKKIEREFNKDKKRFGEAVPDVLYKGGIKKFLKENK